MAVAVEPEDLEPEVEALLALLLPGEPVLLPAQLRLEGLDLVATLEAEAPGSAPAIEASLLERLQALRQRGFTEADLRRARTAWSAGQPSRAFIRGPWWTRPWRKPGGGRWPRPVWRPSRWRR